MVVYIIRRFLALALLLVGVSLITFLLVRSVPGDPAALYHGGVPMSESELADLRRQWGLDRPLPVQYLHYLDGVVRGNFGVSLRTGRPILADMMQRLPATIELALAGTALALLVGIPLGVLAALKHNRLPDHVLRMTSLLALGMPSFWLGLVLIYLFGYLYPVFPPAEGRIANHIAAPVTWTDFITLDSLLQGNWLALRSSLSQLAAPAITVALGLVAVVVRMLRSSLLEELRNDYVRTAHAKGAWPGRVHYRHALRNALIPTITVVGLQLAGLLGGNVLVESVFAWPGIGLYYLDAINNLDYNAVTGVTLLMALVFGVMNLLVDVAISIVDPRVRYA